MVSEHILWYDREAGTWTEALALGNGRLGAMAFGGAESDRFALNEDSLWSGFPRREEHAGGPEALKLAREQLDAGDLEAAQKTIEGKLTGHFTEAYMPLGDLLIERRLDGAVSDYRRELDLSAGVHSAAFTVGKVRHRVTSFVTNPHQALVIKHECDVPGGINESVYFGCQLKHEVCVRDGRLSLEVECPGHVIPSYLNAKEPLAYYPEPERRGIRAMAEIACETDGAVEIRDGRLFITGAKYATYKICARSSYAGWKNQPFTHGLPYAENCDMEVKALAGLGFAEMLNAHVDDFTPLMERVDMDITGTASDLPTDRRLMAFDGGDTGLYELLFNFGRYLTVSGSRSGSQATNLQGIWNESVTPPWSSNYTVNINTEMNYYPVEMVNLSEMSAPLFDLIDKMCESGRDTARTFYGMNGSACHHNTDIWGRSNPMGDKREGCAVWAFWPMSLCWMCHHLFDHYLYTLDADFLRERALPVMREALRFLLDFMVKDEKGRLRVYPATSPENSFIYKGKTQSVALASGMSNAIARELAGNYIKALDILGIAEPMRGEAEAALKDIWPYEIGSQGQILEWDREYEEAEPHHRHTSHLYGLHPGYEITPEGTPELLAACKRTLEMRGDDGTGWCLGWRVCMWARLKDGDHALKLIKNQLRLVRDNGQTRVMGGGTYPNMLDAHPPFQIDGNYGVCSGICEMLLCSRPGEIELLPALPGAWKNGHVRGLKAMGRAEVEIRYENGILTRAVITTETDAPITVKYKGRTLKTINNAGVTEISWEE